MTKEVEKSPYDDAGMPLGTTYADYDNGDEVKANMVKDKVVKHPVNDVFDTGYQGEQLSKKFTGVTPLSKKNFNSAIEDGVGFPEVVPVKNTEVTDYTDLSFLDIHSNDPEGKELVQLILDKKEEKDAK